MELKKIPCPLCGGLRHTDEVTCRIEERDSAIAFGTLSIVRCPTCSLLYLNPMPVLTRQEELENYGEEYFKADYMRFYAQGGQDSACQSNEDFSYRLNVVSKFSRPGRLLDVGCASGGFLRAAQKQGWQAYGVELSERVADIARKQSGLEVFCGTLHEANFESDFFDCVCLGDILEHVFDPASFLAEARRVLKPGGLLYVAMPNAASLYFSIFSRLARMNRKNYFVLPHHVIHYTPKTLKRVLWQSGFDVVFKASSSSSVMHKGLKGVFLKALGFVGRIFCRQDRVIMLARKRGRPGKPTNILYLSDTGTIIGGGQISLLGLLERLDRGRFNPVVVVPQKGDFEEKLRILETEVLCVPYRKIKNPFNIAHTLKLYKMLREWLEYYNIDIIHSNTAGGLSLLGAIAAYQKKIPFLWHVRVSESGGFDDVLQGALSTHVIMISQAETKRFPWLDFLVRGILVYNGVDLGVFRPCGDRYDIRKRLGAGRDELLLGTVGRFHPVKGYEYFIEAAKSVLKKVPGAKFVIVGLNGNDDNPYFRKIRALIETEGLSGDVMISGPRDNVPEILSALDVFVLTSRQELFGRVLVEAMGCQAPVVAFNVGGVGEIVEDGVTGYTVPAGDTAGLSRKIVALLQDESLRRDFGANGRRRAEEFFDIKCHVRRIEALYERVIKI